MTIEERIRICRLSIKIKEHNSFSKSIGLKDNTKMVVKENKKERIEK